MNLAKHTSHETGDHGPCGTCGEPVPIDMYAMNRARTIYYHRTDECALEHASRGSCAYCGDPVYFSQYYVCSKVSLDQLPPYFIYHHKQCYSMEWK